MSIIYAAIGFLVAILVIWLIIIRYEIVINKADEALKAKKIVITYDCLAKTQDRLRKLHLIKAFLWIATMIAIFCMSIMAEINSALLEIAIIVLLAVIAYLIYESFDDSSSCSALAKSFNKLSKSLEKTTERVTSHEQ